MKGLGVRVPRRALKKPNYRSRQGPRIGPHSWQGPPHDRDHEAHAGARTSRHLPHKTTSRTFRVYADEWIGTTESPGIYTGRTSKDVSDGTLASYRDALDRFARPYFGTTRIDPPMLKRYIAHVAAHKVTRPKTPMWLTAEQTKALLEQIPASHADLVCLLATTI